MRIGLIGALAVLAVGAGCAGSSGAPTTSVAATVSTTAPVTTTAPSTAPPDAVYAWRAGDCLGFSTVPDLDLLPYAPYGSDGVVPCGDFHTHEVIVATTVPDGPADPFPGDALSVLVADTCTAGFADHAGVDLRDSWYELVYYLPDADEWTSGERYLACVLYRVGTNGLIRELRGTVAGDPAAATWPVAEGDCLRGATAEPRYGGPVSCTADHTHEVVGDIRHPDPAGTPYPGTTPVIETGLDLCAAAFVDAGGDDTDPRVVVTGRFVGRADWDNGYRRLLCVAQAFTEGGELLEGRGSLVDRTWEPVAVYRDNPALTA